MLFSTRSSVALAALGLLSLGALHCSSKSCTTIGCDDGARIQTNISTTVDELPMLKITVCHKDDCASGTPVVTKQTCGPNVVECTPPLVQCKLSGTILTDCSLGAAQPRASYVGPYDVGLDVTFYIDKSKLADGDVYTIRVEKAGVATPLINMTRIATYSTYQPNGEDCAGSCKSALLAQ